VADADVAVIAAALSLNQPEVVDAQWADNGPGWVALLLRDAEAVLAVEPPRDLPAELSHVGVVGPHPADGEVAFEVRAFTGHLGDEDPVTGSLNASVAQWLVGTGRAPTSYVAAQGTRLQRRGRVHVEQAEGEIWVGGGTVVGVTGEVDL